MFYKVHFFLKVKNFHTITMNKFISGTDSLLYYPSHILPFPNPLIEVRCKLHRYKVRRYVGGNRYLLSRSLYLENTEGK